MTNTILAAILVIVVVTLILVALLLFIKTKLTPSGTVKIDINDGKKVLDVPQGGSPPAAARATAASASARSSKAADRSSPPRWASSPASRSPTTGVSAAR